MSTDTLLAISTFALSLFGVIAGAIAGDYTARRENKKSALEMKKDTYAIEQDLLETRSKLSSDLDDLYEDKRESNKKIDEQASRISILEEKIQKQSEKFRISSEHSDNVIWIAIDHIKVLTGIIQSSNLDNDVPDIPPLLQSFIDERAKDKGDLSV